MLGLKLPTLFVFVYVFFLFNFGDDSIAGVQAMEFTCSKFDGFAACYHNNWKKRDSKAATCNKAERWSYSFDWGGRCYCYRCVWLSLQKSNKDLLKTKQNKRCFSPEFNRSFKTFFWNLFSAQLLSLSLNDLLA